MKEITNKERIEKRLETQKVCIKLPFELHKQLVDVIFAAAADASAICSERERVADPVVKEVVEKLEKHLVKLGLREIRRRLANNDGKYIQFHISIYKLLNILTLKG